jgi:hypothetical protein
MIELKDYAISFILIIAVLAIGGAVAALTVSQAETILGNNTPAWFTSSITNAGSALSTFAGFLPIVAIAVIGGLALYYLMRFVAGPTTSA